MSRAGRASTSCISKPPRAAGGSSFPELAIDVWRRERSSQDKPLEMEYAIVYRGTVGGGGWVSNLRGLTAMIPFVWDQYRQAAIATDAIIDQVLRLHALADSLLGRDKPTALRFRSGRPFARRRARAVHLPAHAAYHACGCV